MSKITHEDFERILIDILHETTAGNLLTIPGIAEILMEFYNNDVLARWEIEQAEDEDEDE